MTPTQPARLRLAAFVVGFSAGLSATARSYLPDRTRSVLGLFRLPGLPLGLAGGGLALALLGLGHRRTNGLPSTRTMLDRFTGLDTVRISALPLLVAVLRPAVLCLRDREIDVMLQGRVAMALPRLRFDLLFERVHRRPSPTNIDPIRRPRFGAGGRGRALRGGLGSTNQDIGHHAISLWELKRPIGATRAHVAVKRLAGGGSVDQLNRSNLDDAMTAQWVEFSRLGVDDDLTHCEARSLRLYCACKLLEGQQDVQTQRRNRCSLAHAINSGEPLLR
jgi:hypothetical protein